MHPTTRYFITKWYDHPESGRACGLMTIDTPLSRDDVRTTLRNHVMTNLARQTVFSFPGVGSQLNPYTFVDKEQTYIEPVIETEAEYEERMLAGAPLPAPKD